MANNQEVSINSIKSIISNFTKKNDKKKAIKMLKRSIKEIKKTI